MQVRNAVALVAVAVLAIGGSVALGARAASAHGRSGTAGFGAAGTSGGATSPRAAVNDAARESSFVSIPPCRIVDTRVHGQAIAKGASSTFAVVGSASLAAQGGSTSGCRVPAAATSISATVIATGAAGSGFLRGYATGAAAPQSSFLNFLKGTTSSAAVLPIAASGSKQLTVQAEGSGTDVVVDVTGYAVPPMDALVDSDGTLEHGSRVVTTDHYASGTYIVEFDRNVTSCVFAATSNGLTYLVETQNLPNNLVAGITSDDSVGVRVVDTNAQGIDESFFLTVTC